MLVESAAVFAAACAFLLALAPAEPFSHELGVCESGAVRDVLAGNIILPHFIPGPMVHVPPLYWWSAALGVHAFGWTEIALRMPSIIGTALACSIVFGWAAIAINRRTAFWAASSLLLCHFVLDAARQPRMDSMLALFVTAAAIAFERALRPSRGREELETAIDTDGSIHTANVRGNIASTAAAPTGSSSRRIGLTLAAIAMGLGILTKGILGILLPGLVAGLYLVVRRRWRDLFRPGLIVTFVAALAIGLSWYGAAYQIGGQKFLQWQLAMNLWSRFIPAEAGGAGYCVHPFWYFTPVAIVGFLPWSAYLPAFAIYAWPRRGRKLPEATVFTLCWFTAIFVFFSTSHGKCMVYILPAFPPLAVLTGITIDAAASALPGSRKRVSEPLNSDFDAPAPPAPPVRPLVPSTSSDAVVLRHPITPARPPTPLAPRDRAFIFAFVIATTAVAIAAIAIALASIGCLIFGVPPAWSVSLHPTDRLFLEIFTALATRYAPPLLLWVFASAAGASVVLIGLRRRAAQIAAAGVLAIAAAGSFFWFAVMNPALAKRETLRDFARAVALTLPADNGLTPSPNYGVVHLGLSDCDLNFYSPQPLTPIYRLTCDASAPRFVVARELDFAASPSAIRVCFKEILESAPVDNKGPRVLLQRIP